MPPDPREEIRDERPPFPEKKDIKPVRERLRDDLEARYDKLVAVLENAMDSTKKYPVFCTNCKHRAYAEVPNVKDQLAAAEFFANQGLGRPAQSDGEEKQGFEFVNKVVLVGDDE